MSTPSLKRLLYVQDQVKQSRGNKTALCHLWSQSVFNIVVDGSISFKVWNCGL